MPYRTSGNMIEGIVLTIDDIDRARRTKDSLQKVLEDSSASTGSLDAILDEIPIGIAIAAGPDVRIRAVSRYARELTGRSNDSLIGLPLSRHVDGFDFYHADGTRPRPEELPLARAALTGEMVRHEIWQIARRDGSRVPLVFTAAPVRGEDGTIKGAVAGWIELDDEQQRNAKQTP
jgi:PAS domain S-box-containing protein